MPRIRRKKLPTIVGDVSLNQINGQNVSTVISIQGQTINFDTSKLGGLPGLLAVLPGAGIQLFPLLPVQQAAKDLLLNNQGAVLVNNQGEILFRNPA